jgi:hypothetical protein
MKEKQPQPNYPLAVLAGALAYLIPGAGHILLGRYVRGVIVFLGITGLFWTGIGFGGVFTVDPAHERWWYAAQTLTGVSGLYARHLSAGKSDAIARGLVNENKLGTLGPPLNPVDAEAWWKVYNDKLAEDGLAVVYPVDVVSRAYSGVAGMLNLLVIFDAMLLGLMGRAGEEPPEPQEASPGEAKDGLKRSSGEAQA